jgi:hypothetical protein
VEGYDQRRNLRIYCYWRCYCGRMVRNDSSNQDLWIGDPMTIRQIEHDEIDRLRNLFVGQSITKINDDQLELSNGTKI